MTGFSHSQIPPGVAQGVLRGDRSAIAEAYRLLSRPVMNLAGRILQDRGLAEEVVQDTFIDLVEKAEQIRDGAAIGPWVRRVATNHCLMKLRSPWHARRSEASSDQDLMHTQPGHGDVAEHNLADAVMNADSIEQALAGLSGEARAVVWLHDVEGYTHKEIGEFMGKTASFSKSLLARSYEKLLAWSYAVERQQSSPELRSGELRTDNSEAKHAGAKVGTIHPTCAS